jgi:RNA polymerase sigma-70 factor (ECF subfamily)
VQDVDAPATGFTELYATCARDVWRYALSLSGDTAAADDLTAEAFLRVWEARAGLRVATAKAYLLAIVRNLYRREWHRNVRRQPLDESLAACGVDYVTRERAHQAIAALQQLPEHDRSALLLRAEHGLGYSEIAAILGSTEGAVRVQVHRARERLSALMEKKP